MLNDPDYVNRIGNAIAGINPKDIERIDVLKDAAATALYACVLCSSQVRAAQVMRCLASANAASYRLPATRLSGCKTSAPSQADVDHPEPQEVLVSKEACLQFGRKRLSRAAIAPFRL